MSYTYTQTMEYLASIGADFSTMSVKDSSRKFYYGLTISLTLQIVVTESGNTCELQSDELGGFTMPIPTFSDTFGLHDYIKAIPNFPSFKSLKATIKIDFMGWIKAFEQEYSFKQFQEAIRRDIACCFILPLSYYLNREGTKYGVSTFTIYYMHPFDNVVTRFSMYDRDILDITPSALCEMDTICELLKLTSGVPEADVYCRKIIIDKVLTDL